MWRDARGSAVFTLCAQKGAVEASPPVVSFWLEVSAKLPGLPEPGKQGWEGLPVAGQLRHWQGAQAKVGTEVAPSASAPQTACTDRTSLSREVPLPGRIRWVVSE